jgi:hypothetical protein
MAAAEFQCSIAVQVTNRVLCCLLLVLAYEEHFIRTRARFAQEADQHSHARLHVVRLHSMPTYNR